MLSLFAVPSSSLQTNLETMVFPVPDLPYIRMLELSSFRRAELRIVASCLISLFLCGSSSGVYECRRTSFEEKRGSLVIRDSKMPLKEVLKSIHIHISSGNKGVTQ